MTKIGSLSWHDKYADELADIFGVLLVLSLVGFLPFFYIFDLLPGGYWLTVFIAFPFAAGIPLFCLTIISARKALNKIRREDDRHEKETRYVLSEWSIGTLKAIEAPLDLTKALETILEEKRDTKTSIARKLPNKIESKGNSANVSFSETFRREELIAELEEKLGKVRHGEIKELVLKYTRRD